MPTRTYTSTKVCVKNKKPQSAIAIVIKIFLPFHFLTFCTAGVCGVCECVHVHLVGVSTCVCMHIWCVCTRVHACTSDGWVCGCTGVHMCRCVRRWVGASMCVGGWQWMKPSKFNSGGTNNSPTIILPPSPSKLKICSPWNNFTSPSTHSWKDEISLEPKSPVSHNPKPPNYSAYIFYMLQGTKTKKKKKKSSKMSLSSKIQQETLKLLTFFSSYMTQRNNQIFLRNWRSAVFRGDPNRTTTDHFSFSFFAFFYFEPTILH